VQAGQAEREGKGMGKGRGVEGRGVGGKGRQRRFCPPACMEKRMNTFQHDRSGSKWMEGVGWGRYAESTKEEDRDDPVECQHVEHYQQCSAQPKSEKE
jgi:hypothetical protein